MDWRETWPSRPKTVDVVEGVDVSHHQGDINWQAAKATSGIAYAYVKLTEGVGYADPHASAHLTAVRRGDVVPGVYHFARPDTNTGGQDADYFCAEVLKRGAAGTGWLPPCLDLEERKPGSLSRVRLVPWVSEWIATVRRKTRRRQVVLYASTAFLRDRLGGLSWLDHDVLVWVAHYGRKAGEPGFRDGRTIMHQYTQAGRVAGYAGEIDRNVCWVDLRSLTGGRVPAPPPAKPAKPPAKPSKPAGQPAEHTVLQGETLASIAARFHVAGGWQALHRINRDRIGPDPDVIHPGMKLRLKAASGGGGAPRSHVVAPGETLASIAAKFHVAGGWRAIYDANRKVISDPDHVEAGWRLVIP